MLKFAAAPENSLVLCEDTCQCRAVLLRRERPGDERAIGDVHDAAFASPQGGAESGGTVEARLVEELRADDSTVVGLSLVALAESLIVGHVVCSTATVGAAACLGLGPLGVLPRWQRQGVGKALMHGVLAAADVLGAPAVMLLGSPRFYAQFGFVLAETLGIFPPYVEWRPHFQIRTLAAWEPGMHGEFRYAPAFQRLGS